MPWVNKVLCNGCSDCLSTCVLEAIIMELGKAEIDMDGCHRCGACHDVCPESAICYGEPPAHLPTRPAVDKCCPGIE